MTTTIRDEKRDEAGAIHGLTAAAFKDAPHADGTEPFIVDRLREADALTISIVAERDGALLGHVAVSPVTVGRKDLEWFGLGPISVAPAHQRQGIGSALMKAALERLKTLGAAGCVLLGDPAYYHRFGFEPAAPLVLEGVAPAYFQAVDLKGPRPAGIVRYHAAFGIDES